MGFSSLVIRQLLRTLERGRNYGAMFSACLKRTDTCMVDFLSNVKDTQGGKLHSLCQRILICVVQMEDALSHGKPITVLRNILSLISTSSGAPLSCGMHKCPSSCHQIVNHSKVKCQAQEQKQCSEGHKIVWRCSEGEPRSCQTCERTRKQTERKLQKSAAEQARKQEDAYKHQETVRKYDEKIQQLTEEINSHRLKSERAAVIEQKEKDLANAQKRAKRSSTSNPTSKLATTAPINLPPASISGSCPAPMKQSHAAVTPKSTPKSGVVVHNRITDDAARYESPSRTEWQRQREQLAAVNPAIDKIMEMIGLEQVKSQVLRIKAKVDTSIRQNTDLKKERFGLVLLGNPGTGLSLVLCIFL